MSNIGDRFRSFVDYEKGDMSYASFAKRLDMSSQRMYNLFKGQEFGLKVIKTLMIKFPELNVRWLVLGEGDMILKEFMEKKKNDILFRMKETESLIPFLSSEQLKRISSGGILTGNEIRAIKENINTQNGTHCL